MRVFTKSDQRGWGDTWQVFGNTESVYSYKRRFPQFWKVDRSEVGLRLTITGWKNFFDRPRVGDHFHVPMQSGRLGDFVAESVKYEFDPPDMFFARCVMKDYVQP